jgi:predicted heme/steroid binding protein
MMDIFRPYFSGGVLMIRLLKIATVTVAVCTFSALAVDSTGGIAVKVAPNVVEPKPAETTKSVEKVLTLKELSEFNGKNGKPAYIAVDGVIYDVTNAKPWQSGEHKGGKVGTDISKNIKSSPHGKKVTEKLPVVGKLAEEKK